MNRQYTVTLVDARDLAIRDRIEAEARFACELEWVLGGELYVAQTYAAWLNVSQARAEEIDRITALTAARWPVAINAATQAGFIRLGNLGDARFEVRLEPGHLAASP